MSHSTIVIQHLKYIHIGTILLWCLKVSSYLKMHICSLNSDNYLETCGGAYGGVLGFHRVKCVYKMLCMTARRKPVQEAWSRKSCSKRCYSSRGFIMLLRQINLL